LDGLASVNKEQREKLLDYAARGDRKPEPVFVGRDELFRTVAKNLRSVISDGWSTGSTVCITGPAGAGKSAFVEALKKRRSAEALSEIQVHCVEISGADLYSPGCVLASFSKAIAEWTVDEGQKKKLNSPGVSVLGTGGSLSWDQAKRPYSYTFPADLFHQGAAKLLSNENKKHAFIIVVDEAQKITTSPNVKANALLANLHEGVNLPIVPVLAGLPNTQENIRETISRFSYGNEPFIAELSLDESKDYVEKMLNWLGAEGTRSQNKKLTGWIVKECGGWPHHLSNAMKALAEGFVAAQSMQLDNLDGELVSAKIARRRLGYYRARIAGHKELTLCKDAAIAVLKKASLLPPPILNDGLIEETALALKDHPSVGASVAAEELAFALKMSGLLVQREKADGNCEWICPIANMRRFVEFGHHSPAHSFPNLAKIRPSFIKRQRDQEPGDLYLAGITLMPGSSSASRRASRSSVVWSAEGGGKRPFSASASTSTCSKATGR